MVPLLSLVRRPAVAALPTQMAAAALVLAWLSRLGVPLGLPTDSLRYLDIVLVPVAFALAVVLRRDAFPRFPGMLIAIGVFVTAGILSGSVNELPAVQVIIGVLLYVVPFLACAVVATEPDDAVALQVLYVVAVIIAIQPPLVLTQWLMHGVGDEVRGSLFGAGAGAHLVGAAALVGAALTWAWKGSRPVTAFAGVVALFVIYVADAKQVGAVIPVVAALALALRLEAAGASLRRLLLVPAGILAILVGPVLWLLSKTYVANIFRLTVDSGGGKIAVVRAVWSDVWSGPVQAVLGFGPGETVSRWAWMLSGQDPTSAPLTTLNLEVSERAVTYQEAALGQGYVGESSFTQSLSSLLGVLGDYGVLGVLGYVGMVIVLLRLLVAKRTRLSAVCVGLLLGMVALGAIGDWLEQTPVMVMVMVVAGLGLRAVANQGTGATDLGQGRT